MASIPTYIYVGDPQVNGGYSLPPTGFPGTGLGALWGFWNNYPKFNRVIPSGADGVTGGAFEPYWDGTMASGAGSFVKYIHAENTVGVPGANGDNWYIVGGGGGVSPCTLLMHSLWEMHPTGFKMLKLSVNGGFGTGSEQLKEGGAGYLALRAEWDAMVSAMAPDTPDLRAVVVDATVTDIVAGSLTYQADIESFFDGIRSDYSSDCLILLVSHHADMRPSVTGGGAKLFPLARSFNRTIATNNANVRLFDMNWAQFGGDNPIYGVTQPVDNTQYRIQDYIEAGARMGRAIDAFYTAAPSVSAGKGIATYILIGDSNFVVAGSNSNVPALSQQESLLGPLLGSTERVGQYIWNNETGSVELYDVISNASTFGSVIEGYGPEMTMLKRLYRDNPEGVLVLKYARAGITLSVEGNLVGADAAAELAAGTIFEDIQTSFALLSAAVVRDIGRTLDVRGIGISLGGNDAANPISAEAFATKAAEYVDDIRAAFTTRTDGYVTPVVWLQPPPPASTTPGGTIYGDVEPRESVRSTVAALVTNGTKVGAVLDPGGKFELQRGELIHYAAEAIYDVGYELADKFAELESGESATEEVAATSGDVPSGAVTLTVEDGSGSSSATSYATLSFADSYHQTYGNPSAWSSASTAYKNDALRVATQFLDLRYGDRWSGVRLTSEQALDWPRSYVIDSAGNDVGEDEIPVRLMQATAKAALLHLQGTTLVEGTQTGADISSESKSLPGGLSKSVTYVGGKPATATFPAIDRMLQSAGLIESGSGWGYSSA